MKKIICGICGVFALMTTLSSVWADDSITTEEKTVQERIREITRKGAGSFEFQHDSSDAWHSLTYSKDCGSGPCFTGHNIIISGDFDRFATIFTKNGARFKFPDH